MIERSRGVRVIGGLGRDRRQKAVDKKRTRNTDTIRRFQNTASVHSRYRKVRGLKSEVQCLNYSTDGLLKRIHLILYDFWVKNSSSERPILP
jgi:hypothetical protein